MSQTETIPSSCSKVRGSFQSLAHIPDLEGTLHNEESLLSKLELETRRYLKQVPVGKWPPTPDRNLVFGATNLRHLKTYLMWTLEQRKFPQTVRTMLLFECSGSGELEASLFSDVMSTIEGETGSDDIIPPQLYVRWAKHLEVKGDLHGAIRRLNTARDLISGCWKAAVPPLMESVEIFSACATQDQNLQAVVVSLEMVAKCVCNIPHEDYLELKEQINFQHDDRFYQAYILCKDAVTLASSSELLRTRALNQAAESLLKFAAQQEDVTKLHQCLGLVISEAQASLQAHTSLFQLARQEQFFEFVHSLFLISIALDFSDSHVEKSYAATLEERSRFLFREYCIQLCEDGEDRRGGRRFQLSRVDLKICPEVADVLCCLVNQLDLKLALVEDTEPLSGKQGQTAIDKQGSAKSDLDKQGVSRIPADLHLNTHQRKTARTGHVVAKAADTGRQFQDLNIFTEVLDSPDFQTISKKEGMAIHRNMYEEVSRGAEIFTQDNQNDVFKYTVEDGLAEGKQLLGRTSRMGSPIHLTQPPPSRHQEVGLPVDPEDYNIPVYDVPHSIFRDLIGCKFTTETCTYDVNTPTLDDVNKDINHMAKSQDMSEKDYDTSVSTTDSSGMRGFRMDYGYESDSSALVNTFMTTKLPELSEATTGGSLGADSGMGYSLSDCSSLFASSSWDSRSARHRDSFAEHNQRSLPSSDFVTNTVSKARLLKFNPVTGIWSSQMTLAYVGQPLALDDRVKGNCRDALHVQFLHQDEVLGRYVGKRYKRQRPPSQYLQDVTCQKTARFLVTLFNYALKDLRYDIQVVYVPVAHLQLLSCDGGEDIVDWLNVEPYLNGEFIKLTNNLKFCNSQGRTLATALTHFTHSVSKGKLMLVDLQGWLPREGRGVVYLTDPQFHTDTFTSLSACDMGQRGMRAFWETVHPQCNTICHALSLERPDEAKDAMPKGFD